MKEENSRRCLVGISPVVELASWKKEAIWQLMVSRVIMYSIDFWLFLRMASKHSWMKLLLILLLYYMNNSNHREKKILLSSKS